MGGAFPSVGGAFPSVGGAFPSVVRAFPSVGGAFLSAGGTFSSVGGAFLSVGGAFLSVGGVFPSVVGPFTQGKLSTRPTWAIIDSVTLCLNLVSCKSKYSHPGRTKLFLFVSRASVSVAGTFPSDSEFFAASACRSGYGRVGDGGIHLVRAVYTIAQYMG